jgi:hypothetical protein
MRYISGNIYDGRSFFSGYIGMDDSGVAEISEGSAPERPFATGTIVPGLVNCHTHAGDAGLQIDEKMSLEELVAPPKGLKHRYLEGMGAAIKGPMSEYVNGMSDLGLVGFIDFREGGAEGSKLLRSVSGNATILGRPISKEYDQNEIDSILEYADGIGIPSISDMPVKYIEAVADHVHRKGKRFALHASERVREDIDTILSFEPDFLVHMIASSDSDMRRCADDHVPVVICPRSNMYFDLVPPAKRLLDTDVKVAFGTDNAMLCDADIRKEAAVVRDMLGRENDEHLLRMLLSNGREILYQRSGIGVQLGMSEITVFPSFGRSPSEDILKSTAKPITAITRT